MMRILNTTHTPQKNRGGRGSVSPERARGREKGQSHNSLFLLPLSAPLDPIICPNAIQQGNIKKRRLIHFFDNPLRFPPNQMLYPDRYAKSLAISNPHAPTHSIPIEPSSSFQSSSIAYPPTSLHPQVSSPNPQWRGSSSAVLATSWHLDFHH